MWNYCVVYGSLRKDLSQTRLASSRVGYILWLYNIEFVLSFLGELPDPNADAIMSRCQVCSEKAYVNPCAHCDKKCCDDCREAHCDILKREISRVNNQVKRGWHRLEDLITQVIQICLYILLEPEKNQLFVYISD